MLSLVFTLDYEIYGNGCGSLKELVLDPTQRLADLFRQYSAPLVIFAEAIELARIKEVRSDAAIDAVEEQLRSLRDAGHEIALHLHPWWSNARYKDGAWQLDWSERNLCAQSPSRIEEVVSLAISYLRSALKDDAYVPKSFRGGLWLMQPTGNMAQVLFRHGIRVDSSVFKGGRTYELGLDYRPALRNGPHWPFSSDVNTPDPNGPLLEIPIHSEMVPFWEMLGTKRLRIQRRVPSTNKGNPLPRRWRDFLRLRYPRKLDFCRMTADEMIGVVERLNRMLPASGLQAASFVAIGHSKDLVDFDAVSRLLGYLDKGGTSITTLSSRLGQCSCATPTASTPA